VTKTFRSPWQEDKKERVVVCKVTISAGLHPVRQHMVEHEEEDEDVRENKLGSGADLRTTTPPPSPPLPSFPSALQPPACLSLEVQHTLSHLASGFMCLRCAAFKGVEASQVLTISEVNALLKRYVEGQRQDDPNYQVPRASPGAMVPLNCGACSSAATLPAQSARCAV